MQKLLTILFIIPIIVSHSQIINDTNDRNLTLAVRGKCLSMFLIEDLYNLSYNIGTEIIYKERHCIGIDANVFRWAYETDDSDDLSMYRQYEKRSCLLVDYKLNFKVNENLGLYSNVFDKFNGIYKMWYKPFDYPFDSLYNKNFLQSTGKGTFNEPGIGIGIKGYFGFSNFGIDASLNVSKRYSNINEQLYNESNQIEYKSIYEEKLRMYIRLNFFYHFERKI